MTRDAINDEIRAVRRQLANELENDLGRILADVRKRESEDGRAYIKLPARRNVQPDSNLVVGGRLFIPPVD
ncbi:MAG: hypothetical protein ACKVT0_18580 [Planctomycetaceae bacterium]